jgi:hypothetical protein
MSVDIPAVERELRRIPEVRAARIVADTNGTPLEVHVLAAPGKHPKQLVRDVQSVALASQGLELDHRIVSVVQLEDGSGNGFGTRAAGAPTALSSADVASPRLVLDTVALLRHERDFTATVVLRSGDVTVEGKATGSVAGSATRRAVAEATLAAIGDRLPAASRATVEAAKVVLVGEREVAVVVLALLVPPSEELVIGSAPVRADGPDQAIARAVLDASNRRLAQIA